MKNFENLPYPPASKNSFASQIDFFITERFCEFLIMLFHFVIFILEEHLINFAFF